MTNTIVGIDLGTTNSEVAAFVDGQVRVLGPGDKRILPSCVGFSKTGELLVGEPARNQLALYPERTVRSIKRKMGTDEITEMAGKRFLPQEVSALILRELTEWARLALGDRPMKAVITVPAYFSDAQRAATREAGALAGLEVVRILNEPTAASLAYGGGKSGKRTTMVYDLGGGTFDVSIVTVEDDVTEVLASRGNNRLGGDDFDDLLAERLAEEFKKQHGVDVREGYASAKARLWGAAEEAKKRLSYEPYATIREEALVMDGAKPLHLEMEISRHEYEDMIRPLMELTLDSVAGALHDSGKMVGELDGILLAGGSTRIPMVSRLLQEKTGIEPRQDVHPDLCVALGAGVLASRLEGRGVDRVLVDVSPFSFGVSFLGMRGGFPYHHCYKPIIHRNTPLPLTRTEPFETSYPFQTEVDIEVFQGDDEDALKNILVGDFHVEGLTGTEEPNVILCRMRLDLDGILEVSAVEKRTGKTKRITIKNALTSKTPEEVNAARKRLEALFEQHTLEESEWAPESDEESVQVEGGELVEEGRKAPIPIDMARRGAEGTAEAEALMERSRGLLEKMHADDREEAINLHERIENALRDNDAAELRAAVTDLKELLFFIEGRR
ncbi:MAG TPA: Hsp70 family protein [Bryobacteraceae bacterium]|jgi:molecular chaperone DnaK (HSP70)|nr:Hsp70 family protein [Bryobacteraceae bacterium]